MEERVQRTAAAATSSSPMPIAASAIDETPILRP